LVVLVVNNERLLAHLFDSLPYVYVYVGGVAQWLGRRSVADELSLIYA